MKVICINDSDRPNDIPLSKWVKKDQVYTVIEVAKLSMQSGKLGFKLAEINLDGCFPYLYYAASRFRPVVPTQNEWTENTLERLLEEAKEEEKLNV